MKFLFVLPQNSYDDSLWHALCLIQALANNRHEVRVAIRESSLTASLFETIGVPIEPVLSAKHGIVGRLKQSKNFKRLERRFSPDFMIAYGKPPVGWHHLKQAEAIAVVTDWKARASWADRMWRVITPCEGIRRQLIKRYRLVEARIHTLYGGIEPVADAQIRRDTLRKALHIKENNVLIGIIGAPSEHSGHELLMQALSQHYHPNLKLLGLVKDEVEADRFMQLAKRYNIASASKTQLYQEGELTPLTALDIGVIADTQPEGVAKKAVELIAAGVAVVSSDIGANGEVCRPENRFENNVAVSLMDRVISHENNSKSFDETRLYEELMLLLSENERVAG